MATEWIDIADTVVKIGLGALISGVATYYITQLKIKDESNKDSKVLYKDLILEVVKNADEYFHFLNAYYSRLHGTFSSMRRQEEFTWNDTWQLIEEVETDITKSRNCIYAALSRLQLLGMAESLVALRNVLDCESHLRSFYLERIEEIPPEDFLTNWGIEYATHRNQFLDTMSREFLLKCG